MVHKSLQEQALGFTVQASSKRFFQTKILAIERCLDIDLERRKLNLTIHNNSQATLNVLSFYVFHSKLIWECQSKLNEVGRKI